MNQFVDVKLNRDFLDRYYIRHSIFEFIKATANKLDGSLIDVGCGQMPYRSYILANSKVHNYIGVDINDALNYNDVTPDAYWDGKTLPFDDATFQSAMATEVLEHSPHAVTTLSEIQRVLEPGGIFMFTVPFLWPLHEVPHDYYRYTPFAMENLLSKTGFNNMQIYPTGGWDASLAQMIGLWVQRRPGISKNKRKILKNIASPIMRFLMNKDIKPSSFTESTMITGLSGIAYKCK